MTEVLASSSSSSSTSSSAPETKLLGNNASFNFSLSKNGGSLRGQVQLLGWKYLPNEDQRARVNSILQLKRPAISTTSRKRSAGLKNLGNTCFMNSVVQCLTHAKPLFDYCVSGDYIRDINSTSSMGGSLVTAFARLTEMLCNGENFVSPADFKSQIDRFASQYIGHSQQDAQEFLICLLEGLHEDLNRSATSQSQTNFGDDKLHTNEDPDQRLPVEPPGSTFALGEAEQWRRCLPKGCDSRIADLFVGVLRSTLKCQVCDHVSESLEPFIDLSLPVDCSPSSSSPMKRSPLSNSNGVNLLDCLQLLVQHETLDADNRPECERCKQRRPSTKSFSIDRFPPILILHLKRFKHSDNHMMKVETDVKCPLHKLDLTRYATDTSNTSAVYNLFAVCNHSGSPTNGHYTTSARQLVDDETWTYFDDARVSSINSSSVVTSDAYIVFYELSETTSSRL